LAMWNLCKNKNSLVLNFLTSNGGFASSLSSFSPCFSLLCFYWISQMMMDLSLEGIVNVRQNKRNKLCKKFIQNISPTRLSNLSFAPSSPNSVCWSCRNRYGQIIWKYILDWSNFLDRLALIVNANE
jgi:hypothetical protein